MNDSKKKVNLVGCSVLRWASFSAVQKIGRDMLSKITDPNLHSMLWYHYICSTLPSWDALLHYWFVWLTSKVLQSSWYRYQMLFTECYVQQTHPGGCPLTKEGKEERQEDNKKFPTLNASSFNYSSACWWTKAACLPLLHNLPNGLPMSMYPHYHTWCFSWLAFTAPTPSRFPAYSYLHSNGTHMVSSLHAFYLLCTPSFCLNTPDNTFWVNTGYAGYLGIIFLGSTAKNNL